MAPNTVRQRSIWNSLFWRKAKSALVLDQVPWQILGREQAVRFWIWKLVMRTLGLRRMMLDATNFKEVRSFNARQPGGFLG